MTGVMMKIFLLCTLLSCFSLKSFAGDEANNGGGLAENNFIYARENLSKFIEICLNSTICKVDAEEKEILMDIHSSYSDELRVKDQLVFQKGEVFFTLQNSLKIAKTSNYVGSQIFINLDLIYKKNMSGNTLPLSIASAASILLHEFGHHHGFYDHDKLDSLGTKVRNLIERDMIKVPWSIFNIHDHALYINYMSSKESSTLLLVLKNQMIDLSDKIIESFDSQMEGEYQFAINKIAWLSETSNLRRTLEGEVYVRFLTKETDWVKRKFSITFELLLLKGTSDSYFLLEDSISIGLVPN